MPHTHLKSTDSCRRVSFVTPVKTAYWIHAPVLLVTPHAANKTIGQCGFQEVEQTAMFHDCVCCQVEERGPTHASQKLHRVIKTAIRGSAPAQINTPRDMCTKMLDVELPACVMLVRSPLIRSLCRRRSSFCRMRASL